MLRTFVLLAALAASPAVAAAQGTPRPQAPDVPRHMMPPAGKCRIWMNGVPAAQQPAPTDCQTALRQKPAGGTVVFGPTTREVEPSAFRSNPRPPRTPARDSSAREAPPTPVRARPARGTPARADTSKPAPRRPERTS